MLRLLSLLASLAFSGALHAETSAKVVELFNGRDLAGWTFVTPTAANIATVCTVKPDGVLAVAGKPVGYLVTEGVYENYRLRLEWRWSGKSGNSGVLLHIASGPIDRNTWPLCLQLQTKATRMGDLLPMAGAKFAEKLSTAPDAKTPQLDRVSPDSEKPAGEWNALEIVCRGSTIECFINGVRQNGVTQCTPHAGRIGFQLEGASYELRNVRLSPL